MQETDNLLLGAFLSSTATGIYDASFTISRSLSILISTVGFLFLPAISSSKNDLATASDLYQACTKWVGFATFPLYLFIFFNSRTILQDEFLAPALLVDK